MIKLTFVIAQLLLLLSGSGAFHSMVGSFASFRWRPVDRRIQPCAQRTIHSCDTKTILNGVVTQASDDENDTQLRFMYMTEEQDRLLKEKGDYEAGLMRKPIALKPNKVRGGSGGFGGGSSAKTGKSKGKKKSTGGVGVDRSLVVEAHAKALVTDGIVRIDKVLAPELADALQEYLCDLRLRARADIETGKITDSQQRFADVLLNQNRCDLKIPLGPKPVDDALHHVLSTSGIVREVMEHVFDSYDGTGKDAELWELNCFMSNSGARRQLVHADNVCLEPVLGLKNEQEPIVLTCFIALEDVDQTMGPTVWMPGTHTLEAHNRFFETGIDEASTRTDSFSPKDTILKSSKSVVGTIPKGSCVVFDPRVLHCAGGNFCSDPQKTRSLFYLSFKNPKIDNPGCPSTSGYGIATAELTMEDLVADLSAEQEGGPTKRLHLLSHFP